MHSTASCLANYCHLRLCQNITVFRTYDTLFALFRGQLHNLTSSEETEQEFTESDSDRLLCSWTAMGWNPKYGRSVKLLLVLASTVILVEDL
jgi:hypothetical protein